MLVPRGQGYASTPRFVLLPKSANLANDSMDDDSKKLEFFPSFGDKKVRYISVDIGHLEQLKAGGSVLQNAQLTWTTLQGAVNKLHAFINKLKEKYPDCVRIVLVSDKREVQAKKLALSHG